MRAFLEVFKVELDARFRAQSCQVTPRESKDNNSRETSRNKIVGASPSHNPGLSGSGFQADARLPCLILLSSP